MDGVALAFRSVDEHVADCEHCDASMTADQMCVVGNRLALLAVQRLNDRDFLRRPLKRGAE